MEDKPKVIEGGLALDDRGELSFVNDFDFSEVKRFYMVSNHEKGFVRAWHGHKYEAKYVMAVKGSALVGAVKVEGWENPSRTIWPTKYLLSDKKPEILFIPAGYANGFMTLSDDAKLIFFSTRSLKESEGDDYRYHFKHWNIWEVVRR